MFGKNKQSKLGATVRDVYAQAEKMMDQVEAVDYPADPSTAVNVFSTLVLQSSASLTQQELEEETIANRLPKVHLAVATTLLEGCFLYLHLLDRQAFVALTPEGRREFVDYVFSKTFRSLADAIDEMCYSAAKNDIEKQDLQTLEGQMLTRFAGRQEEYGTIPLSNLMPGPTVGLSNSLIGRYATHVESSLGIDPKSIHPASTIGLVFAAAASMKILNVPGLLQVWAKAHPGAKRAA